MMKKIFLTIMILLSLNMFADGFMFLDVDGIKVEFSDIIFGKDYANSDTTASIELNSAVNLTADPNDVFNGGIELRYEFGYSQLDFDFININMINGVSIKGHAYDKDAGNFVYTSVSGIKRSGPSSTWSAPTDYDYLKVNYLYHPGDEGEQNETTFMNSNTIISSETIDFSLLVDTYKVAYYWDGEDTTRHGFVDSWNKENSSYFPAGTAVVGISYLPLYVAVNKKLISETYVVASEDNYATALADLPDTIDEKNSMFVTLVFDADTGEFYTGRTANWDGLYDYKLDLPQFIKSGTQNGSTYTLSLQNYNNGWTGDQSISGFTRLSNIGDTGTATVDASTDYTLHYYRVK